MGLASSIALAVPDADLEVGDPLEAEVRALELIPGAGRSSGPSIPHTGTRPLRRGALFADSLAPASPLAALSWTRLARALERDRNTDEQRAVRGATPYLVSMNERDGARFDLSAGFEFRLLSDPDTTRFADRSGLHLRAGLGFDGWTIQTHWLIGQLDSASRFADPLVTGEDIVAHAEQALIGYTAPRDRWGAKIGRGRWHWGPGREGSLILSGTSAPLTAMEFHATLAGERLHASSISATLKSAAGIQLAAHRLEWQPLDGLRLGATEAAVYVGESWRPLYLAGVLPYTLVQRLETQDEPESVQVHRNNVMFSLEAAWRLATGSRVYAEWLVDDLQARTNDIPNKFGYQVGWDGMGSALGRRVRWNAEYTRLSRFVYTSFFGRTAESQSRPLGFPTGPDAARLAVFAAADLSTDWEFSALARATERGEGGLFTPFVPGGSPPAIWKLSGVIERSREIEAALRWWPSGGVDIAVRGGYEWRENAGHASGRERDRGHVALEVRLAR